MRHLLYIIMCAGLMMGCGNSERGESEYRGIPSTAKTVAENEGYVVFLNDEAIRDSIEGLESIKQVSLWSFDKDKRLANKILLSHPQADGSWFSMEHSVSIPLDSIPTISKVTILSWKGEPLRLLGNILLFYILVIILHTFFQFYFVLKQSFQEFHNLEYY